MKKTLSLVLALALIISCITIGAAADTTKYYTYTDNGDGTCSITGYKDFYTENVGIPEELDGLTVVSITGFRQKNIIKYVKIPDTVVEIGANAFTSCKKLKSVTIGQGVKTIGKSAFSNCSELTQINLRNTEYVGEMAFYGCPNLDWVHCGTALKEIGTRAFWNAKKLATVVFSDTLEVIGDYAFANCEVLPSPTFPDSLRSIGYSSFSNCLAFETITFGTGPLTIGAYAFENCTLLTEVTIPENIISIGTNAFTFREANSVQNSHPVKIICNLGSAGVDYSIASSAPVYIIELGRTLIFGDIDGDNQSTILDARKALRLASKMESGVTDEMLLLGDLNHNGYFDLEDANIILKRVSGI